MKVTLMIGSNNDAKIKSLHEIVKSYPELFGLNYDILTCKAPSGVPEQPKKSEDLHKDRKSVV